MLRAAFGCETECALLLILQRSVAAWWEERHPEWPWSRLEWTSTPDTPLPGQILACDPMPDSAAPEPGSPDRTSAAVALAAINLASNWALKSQVDAVVTAPVSKVTIAEIEPDFRGHTDYLALRAGLERYGRDYLMAFLADEFKVALHSVHLPLRQALDAVTSESILEGLTCLHRHQPGARIAVAGLNPHAGEEGLLGAEDADIVAPAMAEACRQGVDASGPWSPDSVFARARAGDFDWVYALYHDQGLIAVKTLGFGRAVNWTLGLPYLRLSVDHGTAFDIAGEGTAAHGPMARAIEMAATLPKPALP